MGRLGSAGYTRDTDRFKASGGRSRTEVAAPIARSCRPTPMEYVRTAETSAGDRYMVVTAPPGFALDAGTG